jgi:diaminopimelate decarboxylase
MVLNSLEFLLVANKGACLKSFIPALKGYAKSLARTAFRHARQLRQDLPFHHWNVKREDGQLSLHGVKLSELRQRFSFPLHVVDEERLICNVHACQHEGDVATYPVDLFYSYKTNPVPGVLRMIHDAGAGAEVISEFELWLALKLGVDPSRIIYNGPAKTDESLDEAVRRGILAININHREEIQRVRAAARRVGGIANIGIRVVLPGGWAGQFGIAANDVESAYREAMSYPELNVIGIHCHNGHIYDSEQLWINSVTKILNILGELSNSLGFIPKLIDFGGGMPIPTTRKLSWSDMRQSESLSIEPAQPNPDATPSLEFFSRSAGALTREFCLARGWPRPQIVLESGRGVTGNAQLLLTEVLTTKATSQPYSYAVLDAGVNIASIVVHEFHQVFPVNDRPGAAGNDQHLYRLAGPICHLGDTLYPSWRLPQLVPGDLLAIMDSGAYFIADSCSFSFGRPGVIAVDAKGSVRELRRSESFEDLLALDT